MGSWLTWPATKVLINFTANLRASSVCNGLFCPDEMNNRPVMGKEKAELFARSVQKIRMTFE